MILSLHTICKHIDIWQAVINLKPEEYTGVMATKMVLYFPSDDLVKQQWNMLKYYLLNHKGTNCPETHLRC